MRKLYIGKDDNLLCDATEENNPVLRAIRKYNNHPNILWIKSCFKDPTNLSNKFFV